MRGSEMNVLNNIYADCLEVVQTYSNNGAKGINTPPVEFCNSTGGVFFICSL